MPAPIHGRESRHDAEHDAQSLSTLVPESVPLTDAYDKGVEDATKRIVRHVESLIGNERLCPSRARMIDWNRAMALLVTEIWKLSPDDCPHPIDAIYWNEWNHVHQCHRCGQTMVWKRCNGVWEEDVSALEEACPVCGGTREHVLGCPEMDKPR